MKNLAIEVLFLMAFLFSSCEEEDTESFGASYAIEHEYALVRGMLVQFINSSPPSDSCQWDFGDGNFSKDLNPTHVYAAGGSFVVKLSIGKGDRNASFWKRINVGNGFSRQLLTQITILEMPFTKPNGAPWDSLPEPELPDVYFDFRTDSLQETNQMADFIYLIQNADPAMLPIVYKPCCNKTCFWSSPTPNIPFYFHLRDFDTTDSSERIGSVLFDFGKIRTYGNLYPTEVIAGNNGFKVKLNFVWQ